MYKVAIEYVEEEVGRRALDLARELCLAAIDDRPFDVAAAVKELRVLAEQVRLGPSTGSIVRAAMARGIPARRLNKGSLVQLGYGSKQRRILAAETDRTGAIAESIAQDKELTRHAAASSRRARARGPARGKSPKTPWKRPRTSASPWWSSRNTATKAAAWPRIFRREKTC